MKTPWAAFIFWFTQNSLQLSACATRLQEIICNLTYEQQNNKRLFLCRELISGLKLLESAILCPPWLDFQNKGQVIIGRFARETVKERHGRVGSGRAGSSRMSIIW